MRFSALFFLALACPLAARGADAPLTLQAAVDLALVRAPQITAGEAASESAHSLADSAGRLPDPQAVVGVDNLPVTGPDAYSVSRDFMTMRKVGLMQAFPAGAQRRSERGVAAAEITLADAELQATRYAVARATSDAWVRYAATTDSLAKLRALEEDMELGARTAMAALKSGRATTADALAAEASVTELKSRVLQLRGDLRREQAQLARWIGADATRPPAGLPSMDELPAEVAHLRASVHQHVSLRPLDAEVALSEAKLALAEAARRPGWSTEFSYAKRGPDYSDMVSLQFSVDLPLFVRHRQNPVIAARGADLRRAQAEREAELQMHQTEFEQMLAAWETTGERLSFIDVERVPLARERSRAALATYRASQGDTRATLDAFQDETELLLERTTLLIERGEAWSYLRYLTLATPHGEQP